MSSAGRVNNQTVTDKQQQQSRLHETTRLAENMQIERRELEEAIKVATVREINITFSFSIRNFSAKSLYLQSSCIVTQQNTFWVVTQSNQAFAKLL